MKRYFPILLSKTGELIALSRLTQNVKDEISPVMQILPDSYDKVENFGLTNWAFPDNELFLDFSLCNPFDRIASRNLIRNLVTGGVKVVPVMQNNSDANYITLLQRLVAGGAVTDICIHFSADNGGFNSINVEANNLLRTLAISRNEASILLDFGFVDNHNYNEVALSAINIITGITRKQDYNSIIVAASSFPKNLSALTPPGRVYRLQRYEWDIWRNIIAQPGFNEVVKFGDYGTKYPSPSEAKFQGTCSIKYTLEDEYLIYRGEISSNHAHGNGQYIIFADRLVSSADYYSAAFSWGDAQISYYAGQPLAPVRGFTGNATTWVTISQNHHITLLHSLL